MTLKGLPKHLTKSSP